MEKFLKIEKYLSLLIAIIPLVVAAILFFFVLPDTIPHHLNAAGEVTRTGWKGIIFLLPVILFFVYFIFFVLHNYLANSKLGGARYTPKNRGIVRLIVSIALLAINIPYFIVLAKYAQTL